MRDIAKNIRKIRMKRNMTQDELAELLFVTRQTVSNYETGRSRPDVEMLTKIAEILKCDVNVLIYGEHKLSVPDDEKKRLLAAIITSALLFLVYFILLGPAKKLHYNQYIIGPQIFLQYIMLPALYILLGWTVMRVIGLLTKARPLQYSWLKYLRFCIYAILLLYFALILPTVYHGVKSILVNEYVDSLRENLLLYLFSSSSDFSLRPRWLNILFGDLWLFISNRTYLFILMGLLLCLFDFPQKHEKNWIPLAIAFVISLVIYFTADENFTIEVYDPEQLGLIPYGIEVIQKELPEPKWEIN